MRACTGEGASAAASPRPASVPPSSQAHPSPPAGAPIPNSSLAVVLYHIVPAAGALDLSTLDRAGYLITSLDGYQIFYDNSTDLLYDASEQQAVDYYFLGQECMSAIYLVDKVLLPAANLDKLPVIDDKSFEAWVAGLSGKAPASNSTTTAASLSASSSNSTAPAAPKASNSTKVSA